MCNFIGICENIVSCCVDIAEALGGLSRSKGGVFEACWMPLFEVTTSVCQTSDMGDTAKCVMLEVWGSMCCLCLHHVTIL